MFELFALSLRFLSLASCSLIALVSLAQLAFSLAFLSI
jgi:hypothetical protein